MASFDNSSSSNNNDKDINNMMLGNNDTYDGFDKMMNEEYEQLFPIPDFDPIPPIDENTFFDFSAAAELIPTPPPSPDAPPPLLPAPQKPDWIDGLFAELADPAPTTTPVDSVPAPAVPSAPATTSTTITATTTTTNGMGKGKGKRSQQDIDDDGNNVDANDDEAAAAPAPKKRKAAAPKAPRPRRALNPHDYHPSWPKLDVQNSYPTLIDPEVWALRARMLERYPPQIESSGEEEEEGGRGRPVPVAFPEEGISGWMETSQGL